MSHIRTGRSTVVPDTEYRPINVWEMLDGLRLANGETMADLYARLDPERTSAILGVTEGGRYGAPDVGAHGEKLLTNGTLAPTVLPDGPPAPVVLLPILLDGQRPGVRLPPPRLGEHTAALLAELGCSQAEVQAITAAQAAVDH